MIQRAQKQLVRDADVLHPAPQVDGSPVVDRVVDEGPRGGDVRQTFRDPESVWRRRLAEGRSVKVLPAVLEPRAYCRMPAVYRDAHTL